MNEAEKTTYQAPRSMAELLQGYQNGKRYFGESDLDQEVLNFQGLSFQYHQLLNPVFEKAITNGRITTWLDAQHQ